MLTNDLEKILAPRALKEISIVNDILISQNIYPITIADIGANIGYYTTAILQVFKEAEVHSYEPHPENLKFLQNRINNRLHVHPYGLFNEDTILNIGMRDSRNNNGTFSIFNNYKTIPATFKNANNETIKPDFVKLDVEGSELFILQCDNFFENTKAIFIELILTDEFKQNEKVTEQLIKMGFKLNKQITKNDQLWLRL